jgi:hypothetical protein
LKSTLKFRYAERSAAPPFPADGLYVRNFSVVMLASGVPLNW